MTDLVLLWGFMGMIQAIILPGLSVTVCFRDWNWPQRLLFAPPLSLLLNYYLVCLLTGAGIYEASTLSILITAEILWILYGSRNQRTTQGSPYVPIQGAAELILLVLSVATVSKYTQAWVREFGSVFTLWDAIVSWNAWGWDWAQGLLPASGLYPHALPIAFSFPYVLMGGAEIEMFSKATSGLFFLAAIGALIELGFRRKDHRLLAWAIAFIYPMMQARFFQSHWNSGYADVPLALSLLFAFCVSFFEGKKVPWLFGALAGLASLIKQPGLLFAGLSPFLLDFRGWKKFRHAFLPAAAMAALASLPWYLFIATRVAQGKSDNNTAMLAGIVGGGLLHRWQTTMGLLLYFCPLPYLCVYLLLATFGLIHSPIARRWFLLIGFPYFLVWGTFFGYDIRNLSMAIFPFSLCMAAGVAWLAEAAQKRLPLIGLPRRISNSALGFSILALCLLLGAVSARRPLRHWREEGSVLNWEKKQRLLLGDSPRANVVFRDLMNCPGGTDARFLTNFWWATVIPDLKPKLESLDCPALNAAIAKGEKAFLYLHAPTCPAKGLPPPIFEDGEARIFATHQGMGAKCAFTR